MTTAPRVRPDGAGRLSLQRDARLVHGHRRRSRIFPEREDQPAAEEDTERVGPLPGSRRTPPTCSSTDPRGAGSASDAMAAMPDFERISVRSRTAAPRLRILGRFLHAAVSCRGGAPWRIPDDDAVVVNACESAPVPDRARRQARATGSGSRRSRTRSSTCSRNDPLAGAIRRRHRLSGLLESLELSPLAQPGERHHRARPTSREGTYYAEALDGGPRSGGPQRVAGLHHGDCATRALDLHRGRQSRHRTHVRSWASAWPRSRPARSPYTTGSSVDKGDELGMFHFGGSTHCLIFRPARGPRLRSARRRRPGLHSPGTSRSTRGSRPSRAGAAARFQGAGGGDGAGNPAPRAGRDRLSRPQAQLAAAAVSLPCRCLASSAIVGWSNSSVRSISPGKSRSMCLVDLDELQRARADLEQVVAHLDALARQRGLADRLQPRFELGACDVRRRPALRAGPEVGEIRVEFAADVAPPRAGGAAPCRWWSWGCA